MEPKHIGNDQTTSRLEHLERLVAGLERTVRSFADEIRTRQIVVVDDEDRPRIVGEVFADEVLLMEGEHRPVTVAIRRSGSILAGLATL